MTFCTVTRLAHVLGSVCLLLAQIQSAVAAEAQSGALEPHKSLEQIAVDPGLKVELVAREPSILSPVAIRFDDDGQLWVVEMRDYPTGPTKEFPAGSRISLLRDKDGDGLYETATVFADNLSFATGLQPWKGGVFVTMAGKLAYMKDTNGDDKADLVETWYTGFNEGNQQLRANHPRLALDNHIYVASGLRGGSIVSAKRPNDPPVSISGMDFRFDPFTGKSEAVSGVGQFGMTFDDFGNRFVCTNRNPAIHVALEDRVLKKNPLVAIAEVRHDVAKAAADSHLFPIGKSWTTSNLHAGTFTAACGVDIYRGDALPAAYYGNVFTCDPTQHLVHREIVTPDGVTFVANSAREGAEFFASRDEWCCPVNLDVGPDGALYVVDMYRGIIEHPEWMPEELRHRPNLRAGNDRGRIFRVVPNDFKRPAAPKLSATSSDKVVELLAHRNAWWRETAARLLLERQDKTVIPQLRTLAQSGKPAPARTQALRLLAGLQGTDYELLEQLLADRDPHIVEQAIIVAQEQIGSSDKLRETIGALAEHADARVRFAALLTAAPSPPVPKHPTDKWEVDAMLIATGNRGGQVLAEMLAHATDLKQNVGDPAFLVRELATLAAASEDRGQQSAALESLLSTSEFGSVGLAAFLGEVARGGTPIDALRKQLSPELAAQFDGAFKDAAAVASDGKQPEPARCEKIDLLAFGHNSTDSLVPLALGDPSQAIRLRAILALGKNKDLEPWRQLLASFAKATPAIQRAILDGMLSNPDRTSLLLDSIAAGEIKPTVVDPAHAKLLLNSKDAALKSRAEKLLASAVPADREKALAQYRPALELKADASHGQSVFEKRCSVCHRIGSIGVQFAPDISDSRERTPIQLLTDILQPNRAIDSNYFSYTAITADGRVHTGVLAAETSTSITLKQQEGKSETLRRDEIEDLHSDGVSFMPEGLEKDIPPQDMADLISFVKNWRYLENPEQGPAAKP